VQARLVGHHADLAELNSGAADDEILGHIGRRLRNVTMPIAATSAPKNRWWCRASFVSFPRMSPTCWKGVRPLLALSAFRWSRDIAADGSVDYYTRLDDRPAG
jgi:hypothetical protein